MDDRPDQVRAEGRQDSSGDLSAGRAYRSLIARLRDGTLGSGRFVSMPVLGEIIGFPIAATREAVKRAEAHGLLSVMPKRGVVVMSADPETTRACLDFRAMLDGEGARRRILSDEEFRAELDALRQSHEALLADARAGHAGDLSRRAVATDLTLHDFLAGGLGNPLATEAYAVNRHRVAIIQNMRPFLPDRIASAMAEHLAIIDAVARRESQAAVAAIDHHHRQTLRWWGVER